LNRIKQLGYEIKLSSKAKEYIAEKGFDVQFGARPLKRALQKYLEDPLAEAIIKFQPKAGDILMVGYSNKTEELTFKIVSDAKTVGNSDEE